MIKLIPRYTIQLFNIDIGRKRIVGWKIPTNIYECQTFIKKYNSALLERIKVFSKKKIKLYKSL